MLREHPVYIGYVHLNIIYRAVASLGFWLRRGTSVDNSKIYSPSLLFSAMFHEYIFNIFIATSDMK